MSDNRPQSLDEAVQRAMERWTVPGIAVGVWHEGKEDLRAYGVANLETGYEMRTDTLLQIGSISKIFTTTLLMMLVDEGKVRLDDSVASYLPGFRLCTSGIEEQVRVRDLVTHTSGVLGDHFEDFGWGDDALERYVASMSDLRQIYEPGTIWSYTNSGFNLAGRIIETILDKPFEEAVKERIFDPLGMSRTTYFPHEAIVYPVSVGHTLIDPEGDEHEVARRWPIPRASGPAGSISSTVGDMLKFARFHMGDGNWEGKRLLSEQAIKAMQEVYHDNPAMADAWGLGWQINFIDGVKLIGHGGATNGFNAHLDIAPDRDFALIILTNSGRGAAAYREIIRWSLDHYLGLTQTDPEPVSIPGEKLQEYAGEYRQPLTDITVTVDDGSLLIEAVSHSALSDEDKGDRKQPPVHAQPLGDDRFVIAEGAQSGGIVDFFRNEDGSIRFMRIGGRVSEPAN